MEFNLDSYSPIDYRTWVLGDEARNGMNIKRMNVLNSRELELLDEAVPYQDQRNDPGHGENTAYFALKLLNYLPGNRNIVVPAAILHDTGFYGNDSDEWQRLVKEAEKKGNLKSLDDEAKRRPHQNRGIMIAGRIFQKLGFPDEKYHLEIADIIGDHDTRKLPTTENGKIVRTADLLWRVTYSHAQIYMANETPENILERAEETCLEKEKIHLGEIGMKIARIELVNTFIFKFGKDATAKVLKGNYEKGLEKIASFY